MESATQQDKARLLTQLQQLLAGMAAPGTPREEYARLFDDFYVLSAPLMRHMVSRAVFNPHDREDVLHNAYLRVFKYARTFDPEKGSPAAWLAVVIASGRADHYREAAAAHRRGFTFVPADDENSGLARTLTDEGEGEESWLHAIDGAALRAQVDAELDRMRAAGEAPQAECFTLKCLAGLSIRDVGQIMNISESTATNWIYRTRKRVLDAISPSLQKNTQNPPPPEREL